MRRVIIDFGPETRAILTRFLDIWERKGLEDLKTAVGGLDTAATELQGQLDQVAKKEN